ncbi:hypothetical protein CK203_113605 [Vitis vinifera]|uniref:Uncharacterized protein n=1 Tax=Vitis vinifera TaxID=29760 RepID=A0A438C9W7_VITVI|nr:hypothetical protein CK203_113605 [Vitis vinifera]
MFAIKYMEHWNGVTLAHSITEDKMHLYRLRLFVTLVTNAANNARDKVLKACSNLINRGHLRQARSMMNRTCIRVGFVVPVVHNQKALSVEINGVESGAGSSGSQESNASNRVRFGAEMRKIWPLEDNCSRTNLAYLSMRDRIKLGKRQVQQSQWGSKDALNEDMSMKAKLASMARRIEEFELRNVHTEAQPQAMPTSFEYITHPNLTSQPQHQPKDKFAYLSMRDRIELGKRQVQQSQWGSKYALNGDDSYEHTVGSALPFQL